MQTENRLGLALLASLEQRFAEDKTLHFKGTARVGLSQLQFLDPIRPIDVKIVKTLKRNFRAGGCLQHEAGFSIPAIIDDTSLSSALTKLHLSAESFKASSAIHPAGFTLPSNLQLDCLHGQHRIRAATEFLPSGDRWWLVDIYKEGIAPVAQWRTLLNIPTGLSKESRQILREGHSYSTNFTDGENFRQIRVCQFNRDRAGEDRCRARITASKEADLNKLLKRGPLISALDSILPMKGLWPAFHFGSMDIFLLPFDEVGSIPISQPLTNSALIAGRLLY